MTNRHPGALNGTPSENLLDARSPRRILRTERRRTSGSDYRQVVFPSLPDRPRSPFSKPSDDAVAWSAHSGESFRRGAPSKDAPGPIVKLGGHLVEVGTGPDGSIRGLGKVLPQKPIVFSVVPRCQCECGSQKYADMPVAAVNSWWRALIPGH